MRRELKISEKEIISMEPSIKPRLTLFTISIALTILFFLNCATSSTRQFIKPEYKDKRQFQATLLALTLNTEILSAGEMNELLEGYDVKTIKIPGDQDLSYFNHYIGPTFSEFVTAEVYGVDPFFKPQTITYDYKQLSPGEKQDFYMFAPTKGQITYRNIIPDYVLFFEDLYFEKSFVEERWGIGHGSSGKYKINANLEYLIWDNRDEKIAGYGQLNNEMNLLSIPTKAEYLSIIEKFALSIIQKSPWVRKY